MDQEELNDNRVFRGGSRHADPAVRQLEDDIQKDCPPHWTFAMLYVDMNEEWVLIITNAYWIMYHHLPDTGCGLIQKTIRSKTADVESVANTVRCVAELMIADVKVWIEEHK